MKKVYRVHWKVDGKNYKADTLMTKKEAQRVVDRIDNRLMATPNAGAWIKKEK